MTPHNAPEQLNHSQNIIHDLSLRMNYIDIPTGITIDSLYDYLVHTRTLSIPKVNELQPDELVHYMYMLFISNNKGYEIPRNINASSDNPIISELLSLLEQEGATEPVEVLSKFLKETTPLRPAPLKTEETTDSIKKTIG